MEKLFLPSQLNGKEIFHFTSAMWSRREQAELILDCSQLQFAYPFGTLVLMAEIRSLVEERQQKQLPPIQLNGIRLEANKAHSYLGYIGFFTGAGFKFLDGGTIGNSPGKARGSSSYIPITYVND